MKKLHASFMKDLKNEFDGLYCYIISQLETEKVVDNNIKKAFEKVKSHQHKLNKIIPCKPCKYSVANKKLTRTRTDYLISLRLRVQSYLRSHKQDERVAAACIYSVLEQYGKKYYVATLFTQMDLVDDLILNIKTHKEFEEAFTLLGLNDLMDTIAKITKKIVKNYGGRILDNLKSKDSRKGVRKAAYRDMKIMVDAINFMLDINSDNPEKTAEAESLILVIDGLFKDYRTPMKSRNTKRKNKKEAAVIVKELITTQVYDVPQEGQESRSMQTQTNNQLKSNPSPESSTSKPTNAEADLIDLISTTRSNAENLFKTNNKKRKDSKRGRNG